MWLGLVVDGRKVKPKTFILISYNNLLIKKTETQTKTIHNNYDLFMIHTI